jgi:hypothetical protein
MTRLRVAVMLMVAAAPLWLAAPAAACSCLEPGAACEA